MLVSDPGPGTLSTTQKLSDSGCAHGLLDLETLAQSNSSDIKSSQLGWVPSDLPEQRDFLIPCRVLAVGARASRD